jgi:hypothetical protein
MVRLLLMTNRDKFILAIYEGNQHLVVFLDVELWPGFNPGDRR